MYEYLFDSGECYIFDFISEFCQNNSTALFITGIITISYFLVQDLSTNNVDIAILSQTLKNQQELYLFNSITTHNTNRRGLINIFLSNQRKINHLLDHNTLELEGVFAHSQEPVNYLLCNLNKEAFLLPALLLLKHLMSETIKRDMIIHIFNKM